MRICLRFALGLVIGLGAVGQGTAQKATRPVARSHALLVGCTRYPALDERYQLEGPGNDVLLMAELLRSRFHFSKESIVILSEKAAAERGKKYLPTRANIEREFRNLAAKARAGDRVVILLGGHGSQQPEGKPDDPDHFEPDGLDEIFLPRDVGSWEDQTGTVKNAIVDKEFRLWLKRIRMKKTSVWVIVDACHAASMIRGTEGEKTREVPAEKLIPRATLKKAEQRAREAGKIRGKTPLVKSSPFKLPPTDPDLVAIYAAQSTEPTVERQMPLEGKERKPFGLLTYTICQVVTQARTPLTYTELVQRVQAQYLAWGRSYPTPLVEGKDRDREILGDKEHRGRSRIRLARDANGDWKVNTGALHGLTAGSILAVYPPAGAANADKRLGHVQVTEEGLTTLDAQVQPCVYRSSAKPSTKDLRAGGRCEVVFVNYGDQRLKLAVDPLTDKQEKVPAAILQRLGRELAASAKEDNAPFRVVASPGDGARWVLRLDALRSGKLYLVPASGWRPAGAVGKSATRDVSQLPPLFGPVPKGDRRTPWLRERLSRIARVQNLIALTAAGPDELARDDSAVKVHVDMLRFRNRADKKGEIIRWESSGLTLHKGDLVGFRVYNRSRDAIDINLLLIDGSYGIAPVFPRSVTVDNRIPPGDKPFRLLTQITGDTVALEHLVVIAVKAQEVEQYANFCFLAQPSIERARDVAGKNQRGRSSLNSPLGRLFQNALFAQGKSRGLSTVSIDNHSLQLLSWRLDPEKRGAARPR